MRPSDLAREHGISTQAVRNYEQAGYLPGAERTPSGYRIYTEVHAAALRAYLALIPAYGHAASGRIMQAVNDGELDDALAVIDEGHHQLLRDRDTLDTVGKAITHLTAESPTPRANEPRTIGELAHLLRVTPATLRTWEAARILTPPRDPATGYRRYGPDDIRDAELAHLLRRGGYPLHRIALVVEQIRDAGGTDAVSRALDDWRERLTTRGLAMLDAAAHLGRYLGLIS
ncbi:TioE family transcriptional regulator [Nocardia sp. NPDC057663]|uniref:TioE family transcriptional regulator n=1 Tax=Nocardia sp. NPDC057663 TaxID=3346201 RepID=UPI00366B6DB7